MIVLISVVLLTVVPGKPLVRPFLAVHDDRCSRVVQVDKARGLPAPNLDTLDERYDLDGSRHVDDGIYHTV